MRRFFHHITLITALLFPTVSLAQDDDRGYVQALLEDSLSGDGRIVHITGFAGFLSARATIEEITIADDAGIWLTLKNAALQWDRAAIISGKLEIGELSAAEIIVARLPEAQDSGVQAEAAGFSLPELPISVNIGLIAADKVSLGPTILGEAAVVRLQGSARLNDDLGEASLTIERLDGPADALAFSASYLKLTREIALSLTLSEAANGLVARLIDLPGLPAVALTIEGAGPVDNFSTDIALATDGENRLQGQVVLATSETTETSVTRHFNARLGGNIASLFLPEYQSFFGPDIQLSVVGNRAESGRIAVETMSLSTEAMQLGGQFALAPSGWPEHFTLEGAIAADDGAPVLLPLAGTETRIDAATLSVRYDQAEGDSWSGLFNLTGVQREDIRIGQAHLDAAGQFPAAGSVTGNLAFSLQDAVPQNPELATALGPVLDGTARFDWQESAPLKVSVSATAGADIGFVAEGSLSGLLDDLNLLLEGRATVEAGDISRFAGIAGMPLAGAANFVLSGQAAIGGAFDALISGSATDLAIGQPQVDPLIKGESTLALRVTRDETGTRIERFEIATPEINAQASGTLKTGASVLRLTARLRDIGLLVADLSGAVDLRATASQSGETWRVSVSGDGPAGAFMRTSGEIAASGARADLAISGNFPLVLLSGLTSPNLLSGAASFDLALKGPLQPSSLSGSIDTSDARLALPNLGLSLDPVAAAVRLSNGQAILNANAPVSLGGRISLSGPVVLAAPYRADLAVQIDALTLSDPALYQTTVDGAATISGPLLGGASIGADLTLGLTELQVPAGAISSTPVLANIQHIGEPSKVRLTRTRAGLVAQSGPTNSRAYPIDIWLRAPSRIFLRGRGLDSELGGQIHITGTSENMISQGRFDLIRGRLDILGKRLTLSEGYARLQGSFDAYIYLVAQTRAEDSDIRVTIEGQVTEPEVSFTAIPELPEDEVLSLLLFGRDITKISALQALSLANAVNTLAGRGGTGIVNKLRANFGLDDLDVVVGDDGAVGARLGRYISEGVYTDITIDSNGDSEVNLNLTISPSVNARGSLGSDGQSSLGVFFEKDY